MSVLLNVPDKVFSCEFELQESLKVDMFVTSGGGFQPPAEPVSVPLQPSVFTGINLKKSYFPFPLHCNGLSGTAQRAQPTSC